MLLKFILHKSLRRYLKLLLCLPYTWAVTQTKTEKKNSDATKPFSDNFI